MTINRYKFILISILLISLWDISAWLITSHYYVARAREVVGQKTKKSREQAEDLADSINRNLNYLDGIPDLLSQSSIVENATARFGADTTPSALPLGDRKQRWKNDPELNALSRYLALAKFSVNADIIFVINAAGDCIAASNWNTEGATVGTNFADREYFRKNKNGQRGMQYAIGKTTNIGGLYFSNPIIVGNQFRGAVIAKIDVPNLSFLIHKMDAFITDENGIIILANDERLEMHSLPWSSVGKMSAQKRISRYKRRNFSVFQITSWGDKTFPSLTRVQDENVPHVFASKDIGQYRMKVYVANHVNEYDVLKKDKFWFTLLLAMSGNILILMVESSILYVASIKAKEVALERASRAEQRIISISEDTQQRIGRELHDDLGQLLTGVAFMSEVLFQKLTNQGQAEAKQAAMITAYINEAISKTRILARGLYPVELKEADLPAMLQNLAKNTEAIYPVKCQFICECEHTIDDSLAVINLFRIAQEAVNNAIKHGNPANISLKLVSLPTGITLEISDDGSGINQTANTEAGLGLRSIQYRASLLGGSMQISALPKGGTRLTVSLPV